MTDEHVDPLPPGSDELVKSLRLTVDPHPRLNYALLHNRRPLFRRFQIRKLGEKMVRDLVVEAALQVGSESFHTELQTNLHARVNDFRNQIRLPLTWALHRLPTERVQTTVTTRIRSGDRDILRRSDPVDLQPVDVWVDDDVNRQWLPSFVLPRDPAVPRIVAAAQRYLDALTDDFTVGFDGYQSIDPESDAPFNGVDAQVRAIWSAIVQDFPLRYVNPPPSFELMSQRLRSPSDVLAGGRGTCIDLALLLAACLEYVEIHPALFLLDGHAFVGYWRSEDGYDDFIDHTLLNPKPDDDLDPYATCDAPDKRTAFGTDASAAPYPWVYAKRFYRPIFNVIHRRHQLVPVEATGIPFLSSFWKAVDDGMQNLRSVHDFHSMIDVVAARDHGVTPLPFERKEP